MSMRLLHMAAAAISLMMILSPTTASAQQFRITNMNDVNLGTWVPANPMTGNDPVCIYKSSGNANYVVVGTDNSTMTPAQFRLQNVTNTVEIPYTVSWGNTSSPGTNLLTDGVAFNATGANRTSQTCGGGVNANFKIDVTAANLDSKPAGTYTATVSFLIRR